MIIRAGLPAVCVFAAASAAGASGNLLKNGSFEGDLLYWHDLSPSKNRLLEVEEAHGRYVLGLMPQDRGGEVFSAPVLCEKDTTYTISFTARSDRPDGRLRVGFTPAARDPARSRERVWDKDAYETVKVGTTAERHSVTFKTDVPQTGFWPRPTYMAIFLAVDPIQIDAVTVTPDGAGRREYVPRTPFEVVASSPQLTREEGYREHGYLFDVGKPVTVEGHAFNPSDRDADLTLRFQLHDYHGVPVAEPVDKRVTVPAGSTVTESARMTLDHSGALLARVTVLEGDDEIDSSQIPFTTLRYPKAATTPDVRERFGGSFYGPHTASLGQKIGFAWSRWYPRSAWHQVQESPGAPFEWPDDKLEVVNSRGIAADIVLYGQPKWAKSKTMRPLFRDMEWKADDPRWDDMSIETGWDKFVDAFAKHYRGKPVIIELENEPDLGHWKGFEEEYVKFHLRTVKRIRAIDPGAHVQINQCYAIPNVWTVSLLKGGLIPYVDSISWHDYRCALLADVGKIRSWRGKLERLGAGDIEIWFNEGWAVTNNQIDPVFAFSGHDGAAMTDITVRSIAEATTGGQEKTILFMFSKENGGMSFWDYSGPGTILWDWYGYPLPIVGAWNGLCHHIGLSDELGDVNPTGATFCVFHDLRNGRGVAIAYADGSSEEDVLIELPLANAVAEDIMGNPWPIDGGVVRLPANKRAVVIYTEDNLPGVDLKKALDPLDRTNERFVADDGKTFVLPAGWEGAEIGSSTGNPKLDADGNAVWRLYQLWPTRPVYATSYVPMIWDGKQWGVKAHGHGGQPTARVENGVFSASVRGRAGRKGDYRFPKSSVLAFVAPEAGSYRVTGSAVATSFYPSDTKRRSLQLGVLMKDTQRALAITEYPKIRENSPERIDVRVDLQAGHELLLMPYMSHEHVAGSLRIEDLKIERSARRARRR